MTAYPLDPVELTAELVRIDSVNPALVPGGAGEAAIARYCAEWLTHHGFEVQWLEATPGRPSVVGILRGTGGGKSLMLNGHIDTVSLAGFEGDPLVPRIEGNRMYGRGAFDMKSGVAANMIAAARAGRQRGDVVVCCVADEEHASLGTAEVLRHFTADYGIVTEPMSLELTLWHKGFIWFEITIHGRAYHGSRPEFGIDAIAKAGHFLAALDELASKMTAREGHSQLGPGSIHASLIRGGEEASSYPAECVITVERRTIPGETAEMVEAELTTMLSEIESRVADFRWSLERGLERHPFEADAGSDIARAVVTHATRVLGTEPQLRAEPFWTDASLLDQAGIPCLLFGADGAGAHSAEEWVDIDSVRHLTDVLEGVIRDICSQTG